MKAKEKKRKLPKSLKHVYNSIKQNNSSYKEAKVNWHRH